MIEIQNYIADWSISPFAEYSLPPWEITHLAPELIRKVIGTLDRNYIVEGDIAIHRTAIVEECATVKGPTIIGKNCLIASGAYVRGGVYMDQNCILGPSCEIKTVLMFEGSKVAHLSFVGDSIIGARANIEAGAIVANYRNEMNDKRIRIKFHGEVIDTGQDKFGALIADDVKLGANSVVAPGAILEPGFILPRLGLYDQWQ